MKVEPVGGYWCSGLFNSVHVWNLGMIIEVCPYFLMETQILFKVGWLKVVVAVGVQYDFILLLWPMTSESLCDNYQMVHCGILDAVILMLWLNCVHNFNYLLL